MEPALARRQLIATYDVVRRFAAVVGPPDVEPDDLVQEAFVRALQRGLDDIDDLNAYLRRTVINLSSSARRSWVQRQSAMARMGPTDDRTEIYSSLVSDLYRLALSDGAPPAVAVVPTRTANVGAQAVLEVEQDALPATINAFEAQDASVPPATIGAVQAEDCG